MLGWGKGKAVRRVYRAPDGLFRTFARSRPEKERSLPGGVKGGKDQKFLFTPRKIWVASEDLPSAIAFAWPEVIEWASAA